MAAENLVVPLKDGTLVRIVKSGYHRAKSPDALDRSDRRARAFTAFLSSGSRGVFISRCLKNSSRCWTKRESRHHRDDACTRKSPP